MKYVLLVTALGGGIIGCGGEIGEPAAACEEGTIRIDDAPTSYPSIAAALDVVEDEGGSVVHVCPGTHYEALRLSGAINPLKEYAIAGDPAGGTVIDAGGEGSVISATGVSLALSDLTLTGGAGEEGPPLFEDEYMGQTFRHGGGIYNSFSSITLDRVIIEGNSATLGGAMDLNDNWSNDRDAPPKFEVVFTDCVVRGNRSSDIEYGLTGGGVHLSSTLYRVESYGTDWGEGEEDNAPYDVSGRVHKDGGLTTSSVAFDADPGAAFVCDGESESICSASP